MDIPFFDQNRVPRPKEEIRIEDVTITPYPDRFRVHVEINVTPFQERPNLVLVAHDENDRIVSELNIIQTMHAKMEFTLHLRNVDHPEGLYSLTTELFYDTKNPPQDRRIVAFTIPDDIDNNE